MARECDRAELRHQNNEVKAWLWRYRNAKLTTRRLEAEYAELVSVQESVGAIDYDGMPKGSSLNDLSGLMVARERILSRLIRAKHDIGETYAQITEAIERLTVENEQAVISMRYIQLKDDCAIRSMEEIAASLGYSQVYVRAIHGLALSKLVPIIQGIDREEVLTL